MLRERTLGSTMSGNRLRATSMCLSLLYVLLGSLVLPVFFRRDSTSQEFAIHVGIPRRGSTQRINTMYIAKNATNHNQSSIKFISL